MKMNAIGQLPPRREPAFLCGTRRGQPQDNIMKCFRVVARSGARDAGRTSRSDPRASFTGKSWMIHSVRLAESVRAYTPFVLRLKLWSP